MARSKDLGPAETPQQVADAKAQRSANYRASQTTRNLIAAMLATVAVVLVIVFAVPRGEPAPRDPIDVASIAEGISDTYDRPVIVPDVPSTWLVNGAQVEADAIARWGIIYVPDENSFVNVSQGFDADETWATQQLRGASPTGTVTVDGIAWDSYEISDPSRNANISYALGTQAGADHVLIYGSASPETTEMVAQSLADQIRELQGAAQ